MEECLLEEAETEERETPVKDGNKSLDWERGNLDWERGNVIGDIVRNHISCLSEKLLKAELSYCR